MKTVTVRELRNQGGDVLTRVANGETLVVTRDGAAMAELRPLRRAAVSPAELIARRATLPAIDLDEFRADVDSVLDFSL